MIFCIEMGTSDYLTKPFEPVLLHARLTASFVAKRLHDRDPVHLNLIQAKRHKIVRINQEHGQTLRLRIGIHCGPVVAGVIGAQKFSYDLWGDPVNIASRMKSHGVDGGIQVTKTVYERLKGTHLFKKLGEIPINGKDDMNTYLLTKRNG